MKLTRKQALFVSEYLVDLNATQAAIRAGYSEKTAQVIGAENLGKPMIASAIATAMEERTAKVELTSTRVLTELSHVALSDIGDILDFTGTAPRLKLANEIPEHARRAIQSVKVKRYLEGAGEEAREVEVIEFKLYDKNSGLDKVMRHLGLYKDGDDKGPRIVEFIFKQEGRRFKESAEILTGDPNDV